MGVILFVLLCLVVVLGLVRVIYQTFKNVDEEMFPN